MQEKRSDRYKKLNAAIQERSDSVSPANEEVQSEHPADELSKEELKRKARMGRLWLCVLIGAVVCLALIAVSAAQSVQDAPMPSMHIATTPTPEPTPQPTQTEAEEVVETPEPSATPRVMIPEMAEVYAQNDDLVAWIRIDGTVIDYPVMYTPGDGEFYLYRNFEKEEDPTKQGCVFIDEHCSVDPRGTNLLLHGHNMRRGTMFHSLVEYEDIEYYKEHPIISFTTLYDQEEYEIVYAFRSRVYDVDDDVFKYYKFYQADSPEEFDAFVEGCKSLALYDTGIEPEFGDEFLTLNTCEYTQENGRMVIVARKVKDDVQRAEDAKTTLMAAQAAAEEALWAEGIVVEGNLK